MSDLTRLLTAPTLVITALTLAACGSSSATTGSSPPAQASPAASSGGGAASGTLCSLTTKDEISAVIGKPAADTPTINNATACAWPPLGGSNVGTASIGMSTTPNAAQSVTDQAGSGCAPTSPQVGD